INRNIDLLTLLYGDRAPVTLDASPAALAAAVSATPSITASPSSTAIASASTSASSTISSSPSPSSSITASSSTVASTRSLFSSAFHFWFYSCFSKVELNNRLVSTTAVS